MPAKQRRRTAANKRTAAVRNFVSARIPPGSSGDVTWFGRPPELDVCSCVRVSSRDLLPGYSFCLQCSKQMIPVDDEDVEVLIDRDDVPIRKHPEPAPEPFMPNIKRGFLNKSAAPPKRNVKGVDQCTQCSPWVKTAKPTNDGLKLKNQSMQQLSNIWKEIMLCFDAEEPARLLFDLNSSLERTAMNEALLLELAKDQMMEEQKVAHMRKAHQLWRFDCGPHEFSNFDDWVLYAQYICQYIWIFFNKPVWTVTMHGELIDLSDNYLLIEYSLHIAKFLTKYNSEMIYMPEGKRPQKQPSRPQAQKQPPRPQKQPPQAQTQKQPPPTGKQKPTSMLKCMKKGSSPDSQWEEVEPSQEDIEAWDNRVFIDPFGVEAAYNEMKRRQGLPNKDKLDIDQIYAEDEDEDDSDEEDSLSESSEDDDHDPFIRALNQMDDVPDVVVFPLPRLHKDPKKQREYAEIIIHRMMERENHGRVRWKRKCLPGECPPLNYVYNGEKNEILISRVEPTKLEGKPAVMRRIMDASNPFMDMCERCQHECAECGASDSEEEEHDHYCCEAEHPGRPCDPGPFMPNLRRGFFTPKNTKTANAPRPTPVPLSQVTAAAVAPVASLPTIKRGFLNRKKPLQPPPPTKAIPPIVPPKLSFITEPAKMSRQPGATVTPPVAASAPAPKLSFITPKTSQPPATVTPPVATNPNQPKLSFITPKTSQQAAAVTPPVASNSPKLSFITPKTSQKPTAATETATKVTAPKLSFITEPTKMAINKDSKVDENKRRKSVTFKDGTTIIPDNTVTSTDTTPPRITNATGSSKPPKTVVNPEKEKIVVSEWLPASALHFNNKENKRTAESSKQQQKAAKKKTEPAPIERPPVAEASPPRPTTKLEDLIKCSLCLQKNIIPKQEIYYRLVCLSKCDIICHKACFNKALEDQHLKNQKKLFKSAKCFTDGCGALWEFIEMAEIDSGLQTLLKCNEVKKPEPCPQKKKSRKEKQKEKEKTKNWQKHKDDNKVVDNDVRGGGAAPEPEPPQSPPPPPVMPQIVPVVKTSAPIVTPNNEVSVDNSELINKYRTRNDQKSGIVKEKGNKKKKPINLGSDLFSGIPYSDVNRDAINADDELLTHNNIVRDNLQANGSIWDFFVGELEPYKEEVLMNLPLTGSVDVFRNALTCILYDAPVNSNNITLIFDQDQRMTYEFLAQLDWFDVFHLDGEINFRKRGSSVSAEELSSFPSLGGSRTVTSAVVQSQMVTDALTRSVVATRVVPSDTIRTPPTDAANTWSRVAATPAPAPAPVVTTATKPKLAAPARQSSPPAAPEWEEVQPRSRQGQGQSKYELIEETNTYVVYEENSEEPEEQTEQREVESERKVEPDSSFEEYDPEKWERACEEAAVNRNTHRRVQDAYFLDDDEEEEVFHNTNDYYGHYDDQESEDYCTPRMSYSEDCDDRQFVEHEALTREDDEITIVSSDDESEAHTPSVEQHTVEASQRDVDHKILDYFSFWALVVGEVEKYESRILNQLPNAGTAKEFLDIALSTIVNDDIREQLFNMFDEQNQHLFCRFLSLLDWFQLEMRDGKVVFMKHFTDPRESNKQKKVYSLNETERREAAQLCLERLNKTDGDAKRRQLAEMCRARLLKAEQLNNASPAPSPAPAAPQRRQPDAAPARAPPAESQTVVSPHPQVISAPDVAEPQRTQARSNPPPPGFPSPPPANLAHALATEPRDEVLKRLAHAHSTVKLLNEAIMRLNDNVSYGLLPPEAATQRIIWHIQLRDSVWISTIRACEERLKELEVQKEAPREPQLMNPIHGNLISQGFHHVRAMVHDAAMRCGRFGPHDQEIYNFMLRFCQMAENANVYLASANFAQQCADYICHHLRLQRYAPSAPRSSHSSESESRRTRESRMFVPQRENPKRREIDMSTHECLICLSGFEDGDEWKICHACQEPFHEHCFEACMQFAEQFAGKCPNCRVVWLDGEQFPGL